MLCGNSANSKYTFDDFNYSANIAYERKLEGDTIGRPNPGTSFKLLLPTTLQATSRCALLDGRPFVKCDTQLGDVVAS